MQLIKRDQLTARCFVMQSRVVRLDADTLYLMVGAKLQEYGRLYRKTHIKFDGVDMLSLKNGMDNHLNEVAELSSALKSTIAWCESRRGIHVKPGCVESYTETVLQEWPTMFYATHTSSRITIHIYGRDLHDAHIGFSLSRPESYQEWKGEVEAIIRNFREHIEEVSLLKMSDLLEPFVWSN